jgi:hypothetical protein
MRPLAENKVERKGAIVTRPLQFAVRKKGAAGCAGGRSEEPPCRLPLLFVVRAVRFHWASHFAA